MVGVRDEVVTDLKGMEGVRKKVVTEFMRVGSIQRIVMMMMIGIMMTRGWGRKMASEQTITGQQGVGGSPLSG